MSLRTELRDLSNLLETGEYRPYGGRLHGSDMRYCCLGVACSVAGVSDADMGLFMMPEQLDPDSRARFKKRWPSLSKRQDILSSLAETNDNAPAADNFQSVITFIEGIILGLPKRKGN